MESNALATVLALLLFAFSSAPSISPKDGASHEFVPPSPAPGSATNPTSSPATATSGSTPGVTTGFTAVTGQVTVSNYKANVRTGPGTDYPLVSVLRKGTTTQAIGMRPGWIQVRLPGGSVGWIADGLVSGEPTPVPGAPGGASQGSSGAPAGITAAFEVLGYYQEDPRAWMGSYESLARNAAYLTGIAPFSFKVDGYGNVTGTHSSRADSVARAKGVSRLALVHNLESGKFSQRIARQLLGSPTARSRAVRNILNVVARYGYQGVNIDLENVAPEDRARLTAFMGELASALKPRGYLVTISVPAKTGDYPGSAWAGAFDYAALGRVCDRVMLMTYDEHHSSSKPGPVASYNWVENVARYATSTIPSRKVLLGLAAYGYDWPLFSGGKARAVSYDDAVNLARSHGATILWSATARVPYFRYKTSSGTREVWFENASSTACKLALVEAYRLGGVAVWRLGFEDPALWRTIRAAQTS